MNMPESPPMDLARTARVLAELSDDAIRTNAGLIAQQHGQAVAAEVLTLIAEIRHQPGSGCRAYIAGPITGIHDSNRKAFAAEAARLRALGYEVISPLEICAGIEGDWQACMKRDIGALVT